MKSLLTAPGCHNPPVPVGTADLHIHTAHSDGMMDVSALLTHVSERTSLDVIAIADHDQIAGALEAAERCSGLPGRPIDAVVGTEISASWGRHVLALFFREPYPTTPFPRFRGLRDTVARVGDAGGVVVLPHATSALVPSVGERAMRHLLRWPPARTTVVGAEVCSGVVGGRGAEARLRRLNAAEWGLADVGSSDAHHLDQIGTAYTAFAGGTKEELLTALRERRTAAHWGQAGNVTLRSHARQGWRSLVIKPAREMRGGMAEIGARLRRRPGG